MKKNSFVGTNEYISPEVLKGENPTAAIDLWSLAVIMYKMYSGRTPFTGDNEMETYENICNGRFQRDQNIPDHAWSFIKSILKVNPSQRLGCAGSKVNYSELKSHPYFENIDFNNLTGVKVDDEKYENFEFQFHEESSDEEETVGRNTAASFAVPCTMDDDEEDFYENCFTNETAKPRRPRPYESFNAVETVQKAQNDLLSFIKDDHFEARQRKHSLKCETKNYGIPVLFDEESEVVFSASIGSQSPGLKRY